MLTVMLVMLTVHHVLILKTRDLILYSQNFQVSSLKISSELTH